MLVYFSFECFVILHNNFKLSVLVDNLERSHIGIIEQRKLDIKPSSALKEIKNGYVLHLLVENQIGTQLWDIHF